MYYRTLGLSGLRVSAVGLGCMGMSHAYGAPADKHKMTELLADAVEIGYTFFDTAEIYGTADRPHDNEELLGKALRPFRDRIVIATKFGLAFDAPHAAGPHTLIPDSRPATIRRSVEGSLRRLCTDRIDLYYQHRIDPKVAPEEVADTMADLIREGKITHWGISEASEEYLRRAHKVCPVTAVQNRYSMMARRHETLFPVLEELGIGFVAFSPLANGLLTDCLYGGYGVQPGNRLQGFDAPVPSGELRTKPTALCPYRSAGRRTSRHAVANCAGMDDKQTAVDCADSGYKTSVPVERKHRSRRYSFDRSTGGKHRRSTPYHTDERSIRRFAHQKQLSMRKANCGRPRSLNEKDDHNRIVGDTGHMQYINAQDTMKENKAFAVADRSNFKSHNSNRRQTESNDACIDCQGAKEGSAANPWGLVYAYALAENKKGAVNIHPHYL